MTDKDKEKEEKWRTGKGNYVMCICFRNPEKADTINYDVMFFRNPEKADTKN